MFDFGNSELGDVNSFINRFSGLTEKYLFYNDTVELRYDVKNHKYLLVTENGLEEQDGVTTVCHCLDKSKVLLPWACKMMAQKLKGLMSFNLSGDRYSISEAEFDQFTKEAKTAHKDKLEDAGAVGHIAHAWIEEYVNRCIAGTSCLDLEFPSEERASKSCQASLDWMVRHQIRWLQTERKVYSRKHKYAGTMDGLCIANSCDDPKCCRTQFTDRLTVADWKTSNQIYIEFILQTAAYRQAYQEEFGVSIDGIFVVRLGKEDAKFEAWSLDAELAEIGWDCFVKALDLVRAMMVLETAVEEMKDYRTGIKKAEKAAQKIEDLKIACKGSKTYQGIRRPKCNDGNPCQTCVAKYKEVQDAKFAALTYGTIKREVFDAGNQISENMLESLQKILDTQNG
jgi:hypothetical protein